MENNKNMLVQIKDYQILKKVSLDFVPGLNVIVGPSNNGKSSILKAIKAAVFTVPGTTPIRSGQSNYTVGIQYNGHVVILQKGLKESMYMIDGEKYSKFGQTTPEIVSNSLNIKELVLNGNKEQLNFWDQMNYPFLLDKSGVETFRFIIDSGENDKLSEALKSMVSDRQNLNKTIDMLQGSINAIDLEINNYKEELEKAKPVIESCLKIIGLQQQVSKYNLLKDIKLRIERNREDKERNRISYEKTLVNYTAFKALNNSIFSLRDKIILLSNNFIKLHNITGDLSDVNEELIRLNKHKSNTVQNHQNLFLLKEIKNKINYISEQKKSLKLNPVTHIKVGRDDIMKIIELKSIEMKHREIDYSSVEIKTQQIALKSSVEFYRDLRKYIKICPYCGNPIH